MFHFCSSGAVPLSFAAFGPGSGTILMNKVKCTGTETSLEQCRFKGWDISECNHTEDAAVICQSSELSFIVLAETFGTDSPKYHHTDFVIYLEQTHETFRGKLNYSTASLLPKSCVNKIYQNL